MTRLLDGVRVIDHGNYITGPFAAMMLADLGAEVIKVERPGVGDPFRNFAGKAEAGQGPSGPAFHSYNRNKQSIAIDVSRPEGRDELIALVKTADVYLQNFRPGTVAKWNIGAEALRAVNPRLIYCAISGFGSDGPYAERPAFDTVAQAISGYLGLFVNPDDPVILGPAVADQITGLQSANAILAALFNRERTGKGRLVEMTMVGAMMYFTLEQFQKTFILGAASGAAGPGAAVAILCVSLCRRLAAGGAPVIATQVLAGPA